MKEKSMNGSFEQFSEYKRSKNEMNFILNSLLWPIRDLYVNQITNNNNNNAPKAVCVCVYI